MAWEARVEDLTLAELLEAYPGRRGRGAPVRMAPLAGRGRLSVLRQQEDPGRCAAPRDAVSLPELQLLLLGADGHGDVSLEDRLPGLADRHAPDARRRRRRGLAARTRPGGYRAVSSLSDAAYPLGVRRVAGGGLAPFRRQGAGAASTASMTLARAVGKSGGVSLERCRFLVGGSAMDLDITWILWRPGRFRAEVPWSPEQRAADASRV